jgi:uncharacterized protein
MTGEQMAGLVLALLVMGLGVVGSVIPGVPSTPLILVAAVGHRWYFGLESASNLILLALGALTLFSIALDYLATIFGARRLGATWRGLVGGVLGLILGAVFFNIPGLLAGPFVGALLFEMAGGRELGPSARAGLGAVIGLVVGTLGRIGCGLVMAGLFVYSVLTRTGVETPLEIVRVILTIRGGAG